MATVDYIYKKLGEAILDVGYLYEDESRGVLCKQISDAKIDIPLRREFPLLTTKKMFTKGILSELIWFLNGESNIKRLVDDGVKIWDKDAYNYYIQHSTEVGRLSPEQFNAAISAGVFTGPEITVRSYNYGNVGLNYGVQWRNWTNIDSIFNNTDQVTNLIQNLKESPMRRRHIVTAWNPAELDKTALPPCHWAWEVIPRPLFAWERLDLISGEEAVKGMSAQTEVEQHKYFDSLNVPRYGFTLKWHQRSVDFFLGLPFNIASYGFLAYVVGHLTDMIPLNLVGDLSNIHIYEPHLEKVREQLRNSTIAYNGPQLTLGDNFANIKGTKDFNKLQIEDFIISGYESYPTISAPMLAPNM